MTARYLVEGRPPRRIAVLRALPGLGDFLCAQPGLRALRVALPEAEVTLIAPPSLSPVVRRMRHLLDGLLPFPGYPGIPEGPGRPQEVLAFLSDVQRREFDLVLQMHGNGLNSNQLAVLCGGRVTAGFWLPGQYCPDPHRFVPYPWMVPEIMRHLALMDHLGIPSQGTQLEFPVSDQERESAAHLLLDYNLQDSRLALLHAGATAAPRRWRPEAFAAVGDFLQDRGLRVVLTGVAEEAGITQAVRASMQTEPVDLTSTTELGVLAALLERSTLVVCNDTGVSHLAAALRVPSVVVFAGSIREGSDPRRWAPLDKDLHRAVSAPDQEGEWCAGGGIQGDDCWSEHRCLGDACTLAVRTGAVGAMTAAVTVEAVIEQVKQLLTARRL